MVIKRITLGQLLRDGDKWSLIRSSNKWQYYVDYKNGDWTTTVRIKNDIVNHYLDSIKSSF